MRNGVRGMYAAMPCLFPEKGMDAVATNNSPTRRSGGPKTAEGKAASRQNALKHGFTASALLSKVLDPHRLDELRRTYRAEWRPIHPTETFLVDAIARHAAFLDLIAQAELSVLRSGVRAASLLEMSALSANADPDDAEDLVLTAAVTSEGIDRLTRYRRSHEKAMHQAIARLREIRADQVQATANPRVLARAAEFSEDECEEYLIRRLLGPEHRCPACGQTGGCWLAARKRWQCGNCRRQYSLRTGTVMARSHLPLAIWFAAILCVLQDADCDVDTLQKKTNLTRPATVRKVLRAIQKAQKKPNASALLLGIDRLSLNANMKFLPNPQPRRQ